MHAKEKPGIELGFFGRAGAVIAVIVRPFPVSVPRYDNRLRAPSTRSGYFPKALYPPVATPRVRPKGQAGGVRQKDGASFCASALVAMLCILGVVGRGTIQAVFPASRARKANPDYALEISVPEVPCGEYHILFRLFLGRDNQS